jgi:hypothetical protein
MQAVVQAAERGVAAGERALQKTIDKMSGPEAGAYTRSLFSST